METFISRVNEQKKELGRPLVGLALGSGAARGFAHIGVLDVFFKEGIPIDCITGTSIGSLIGAMVLSGWTPNFLGRFARAIDKHHIVSSLDFVIPPKTGLIDGNRIKVMLERVLKIKNIEDLPKPYAAVSADVVTGERVVHDSGSLLDGVRSSISVPGVFVPVKNKAMSKTLVDGGIVDPVPLDLLEEAGVEVRIGVSIFRKPESSHEPKDIIDILLNSIDIMGSRIFESRNIGNAIVLEPLLGHSFGSMDFDKAEALIELGKKSTIERLPEIKERLKMEGVL
ncbi:MAG: patatin-like phospholipase family protein [Bacillota bacterium]